MNNEDLRQQTGVSSRELLHPVAAIVYRSTKRVKKNLAGLMLSSYLTRYGAILPMRLQNTSLTG